MIAEDLREQYQKDGFIRIKKALPSEFVREYGEEITRLTLELNTQTAALEDRSTYDRAFLQVMNLWRESEKVREFVFNEHLAGIAAQLLGVENVRLYHDQSLYKEPAGGHTPAHADQYYWPLSSDKTVTVWIPLQAVPADMGPLEFYAGSHQEAFGRDLPISDESESMVSDQMQQRGFRHDVAPYDLGDVSFHSGWTFHRAGPNRSDRPRSVMTMIYMDADMIVSEPVNDMQRNDLATWLPGIEPGSIAASPINPVI